jgi:two-component system chemotaxis response regulator CheB
MTGMGDDGAEGLGAIKSAGGVTIAQSEETCVVGGMPRAAIVKGYATKILPLDGMASHLVSQYGGQHSGERADSSDKGEKAEKNEKMPVSTPRA